LSAWSVGTIPTVSPLGPTSRTSGTRIRSLILSSVLMGPPVGLLQWSDPRRSMKKGLRLAKRKPVPAYVVRLIETSREARLLRPDPTTWWSDGRCGWEMPPLVRSVVVNLLRRPDIPFWASTAG
jgi:hypothetical protein